MKYRIRWNYQTAQTYRGMAFGPANEGVIIEADSPRAAIEAFNAPLKPGQRFNPFYLETTEVQP